MYIIAMYLFLVMLAFIPTGFVALATGHRLCANIDFEPYKCEDNLEFWVILSCTVVFLSFVLAKPFFNSQQPQRKIDLNKFQKILWFISITGSVLWLLWFLLPFFGIFYFF